MLTFGRQRGNPAAEGSDLSEDWSILDCLRILWWRRTAFLLILGCAILASILITKTQPRMYSSKVVIEVEAFNENFLDLRDVYPATPSIGEAGTYLQTQAELLDQDFLIAEVARKLHLDQMAEFQPAATLAGRLGEDIRVLPVRNTRALQILCDARDPRLAADLANAVVDVFVEQSVEARQRVARQTYESLSGQLEQLRRGPLHQREDYAFYEAISRKANDARLASVVRPSNVRLIATAEPAIRISKPNLRLNVAIGMLWGLIAAVGFVMLREQKVSTLRAPGDAAAFLAPPELGAIPDGRISGPGDSFRSVAASLLSTVSGRGQILIITSAIPMEGKTTVAADLALALAETGRKVLLIDADLRRPQLHRVFSQNGERGLWDWLVGRETDEAVPQTAAVTLSDGGSLRLMPSGSSGGQVIGPALSDRIIRLFERLRGEFDLILVDAPPSIEFADARILARAADGVLLVVRANHTVRSAVQAAIERLAGDGAKVTGVILNRWNPFLAGRYRSRFPR